MKLIYRFRGRGQTFAGGDVPQYTQAVQTDDGIVGLIFVLSEIDRDIDQSRVLDNQEEPRTEPRTVLERVLEPALEPRTVPEEPTQKDRKKTRNIDKQRPKLGIPRKNSGLLIKTENRSEDGSRTDSRNRERNQGRFLTLKQEPGTKPPRCIPQGIFNIQCGILSGLLGVRQTKRPTSANMSSSPTGCCAVQWAMQKGGGLTSRDRLNSSENYLLLGFLLVRPVQTFLLLVRQPITQDNCSISVSYRSSSNVTYLKYLLTLENKTKLFRRVELGQETIKSKNEVLPFFVNY